jgi:hypothetical protein
LAAVAVAVAVMAAAVAVQGAIERMELIILALLYKHMA